MATETATTLTVWVANTQINHEGALYGPGQSIEAPQDVAEAWIRYGWATRTKGAAPKVSPAPRRARAQPTGQPGGHRTA